MDFASRGATALAASDPSTAIISYTKALIQHPNSPDYFTQRSIALTRLQPPQHDLALKDAEYAVLLGQKRAKREKIQAGQQRRVVSLYSIGRYADAKFILKSMEKWRSPENKKDKMEGDMWMARIDGKLKNIPESDQSVTVKEYPDFDLPDEDEIRETLTKQLDANDSFTIDGEELAKSDQSKETNTRQPSNVNEEPKSTNEISTSNPATTSIPKIRHEWYQNNQSVILTIYAKGISKDKAQVEIQNDSVFISFPHPTNPSTDFTFSLDPLFAYIDSSSSTWRALSTKIEFTLTKSVPGQKWPSLEGTEPLHAPTETKTDGTKAAVLSSLNQPSSTAPVYPTSSRSGPKNWDKLADDLTTKPKKNKGKDDSTKKDDDDDEVDSDYDNGDAVDGFFKKLYAGADPDTRRAMMKSFQESNGTALSTNWSEVGKGKVEPVKSKDEE